MFRDGTQLRRGFELRNGWSFSFRYCSCGDRAPLSGSLGLGRFHTWAVQRPSGGKGAVGGRLSFTPQQVQPRGCWPFSTRKQHSASRLDISSPVAKRLRGNIQLSRNMNECDHGYHSGSVHVLLQLEDLPVSEVHSSQYTAEWALRLSAVGPDLPAGPMLDKSIRTRNNNQF